MSRLNKSLSTGCTEDRNQYFAVCRPPIHEGVGRALRAAYQDQETATPLDMAELIGKLDRIRSEEHTSELQSLMRISYAVFCLKKKNTKIYRHTDKHKTKKD